MGPIERELVQNYNQVHLRLVNQAKIQTKIVIIDQDKELRSQRDRLVEQLREANATITNLSTALKMSSYYPFLTSSIRKIIDLICCNEKVSVRDLLGNRRTKEIIFPRHLAIYLCTIVSKQSLPAIGRQFGNRDHSTIFHARNKIAEMRLTDPDLDICINRYLETYYGTLERSDVDGGIRWDNLPTESGPQEAVGTAADSLFCDG